MTLRHVGGLHLGGLLESRDASLKGVDVHGTEYEQHQKNHVPPAQRPTEPAHSAPFVTRMARNDTTPTAPPVVHARSGEKVH
jgi:hypothetical protein